MVTTRPPKTIVKPTALGPVANTDTKFLIYGLFQKGRVLAQDDLSKGEQASWRKRLQWAYNRPEYEEALTALEQLHGELEERNQSAAGSLEEGLEETLTLHRLGVHAVLGRSFKTTNCLESVSALVEERCAKVAHWKNSSQRPRWLATALVDIEPRLRKVVGYLCSAKNRSGVDCAF